MIRRTLAVVAILLCLGAVGCDKEQAAAAGVDAAAAASGSPIPTVALIGSIASAVLAGLGIKKAGVGQKYAEGGWSRDETAELVKALREHGYKIEGSAV